MGELVVTWRQHPDNPDIHHGSVAGKMKYLLEERDDGFVLREKRVDGRFVKLWDPFKTLKAAQAMAEEREIKTTRA